MIPLLALAALAVAPSPDRCGRHGDQTACYIAHQDTYLSFFGLRSAEGSRAAGEQIRRVMIFGRVGNPLVAVEYRRAPGREPVVGIYGPASEAVRGRAEPAYEAAIPPAEWDRLGSAGAFFDRALVALPAEPRADGAIVVCSDAWLDIVEATDPDEESPRRRLRVAAQDTCQHGLANAYALELARTAVRLLPACGAISGEGGFAPMILAACAKLSGDRMAAAHAYEVTRDAQDGHEPDRVSHAFAPDARLDWMGQSTEGPGRAARNWAANLREQLANFFPDQLRGESASRVHVTGHLERWQEEAGESVLWNAPVELVAELSRNDREFHIARASVGAFARARHFCDPGRLEIRCR